LEGGFGLDIEGTDGSVKAKRNGVKDGVKDGVDGYARVALEGGTKPGGLGNDVCENVNGHIVAKCQFCSSLHSPCHMDCSF
jgi:hypothetical protein